MNAHPRRTYCVDLLHWRYDCSAYGTGNFIVSEDGGNDFSGASVSELGAGGHGVTHLYGDAGSHYLSIDSECSSWSVESLALEGQNQPGHGPQSLRRLGAEASLP
jgi:hypothetical protein